MLDESTLTSEQRRALGAVKAGRNVFVTGPGGVGKSYLFEYIGEWARENGKKLVTCAPTGIAAVKIDGCTIHRALGIGISETIEHHRSPHLSASSPLKAADILLVDEISMCRIDLFDYLTACLAAENRSHVLNGEPTCQLVVMGDFCQLPPVMFGDDQAALERIYGDKLNDGYCYGSDSWNSWGFETVELTTIMRQGDEDFIRALNQCRVGDPVGLKWIVEHSADDPVPGSVKMFGRNDSVDAENERCLAMVDGLERVYEAEIVGSVPKGSINAPQELRLKVGARVMLVVNMDERVNGSMGYVKDMKSYCVTVRFDDGSEADVFEHTWEIKAPKLRGEDDIEIEVVGAYTQMPLRLAYAVTIHKSQGQTFDAVELDPTCWERGQLYTALSRLSRVEGLYLTEPASEHYLIPPPFALELVTPPATPTADDFWYALGKLAVEGHDRVEAGMPDLDVLERMLVVIWNRVKGGMQ